jgi:serine/threonine-protein kinase
LTDWDAPPISPSHLPPAAVPGALLAGKYRLEKIIGHGGMGSVWAATHVGIEQRVAIKIVSPQYARQPDIRRRFDVEAKASVRLKSRYVVQVFDNGELDDGTPYLVMELLEGESLAARLKHLGPVPVADAARILVHVGKALHKAHELGIVHRDIKPENVFLSRSTDDDGYIAKVLDFGIAKMATTGEGSTTRTGSLLGTPMYMSPEQARGLKTVDRRTDVYSLGLVTYAMLTGRPAVMGDSYGDIILKICTQPLPPITAAAPWVPKPVDEWLFRACAKEPGDRFASANELVDAFCVAANVQGGTAGAAGPIGVPPVWSQPSSQQTRQPPMVQYPGAPAVTATTLGATASSLQKRSAAPIVVLVALGFLLVGGGAAMLVLRGRQAATPGAGSAAATASASAPARASAPAPVPESASAPAPAPATASAPASAAVSAAATASASASASAKAVPTSPPRTGVPPRATTAQPPPTHTQPTSSTPNIGF